MSAPDVTSAAAPHDHATAAAGVPAARRAQLTRRAQWLVAFTLAYNVVEAVVALAAGGAAGSAALVGFGLDAVVEVSSGLIILWQFRSRLPQSREQLAARLIAVSFVALAVYVTQDAVRSLVTGQDPDASAVGIAIAALSLLVMPLLSWAKRRTGREMHSTSVVADSNQTLLCSYLSAVLLGGLLLNALLGWGWADPVAALVIAALALREARQAWRGEGCCAVSSSDSCSADAC